MELGPALPLLAGGLAALLLVAAFLTLRRGAAAGRMRERVRDVSGLGARAVVVAGPSIRVASREERGSLRRFAEAIGYNPELPAAHAASVPFVMVAATLAGAVAYWQGRTAIGSPAAVAAALVAAAAMARFLFRRKTKLYAQALFIQIPDTISLVLRAVRAGLPVSEALRTVSLEVPSPSSDEFARVTGEASLGIPLETALWNLYGRTQVREYAFFAVVLGLNSQTGGNLAETLDNLAEMVRRRVAMARKAQALAGEAKASAAILGGLPFVVAILIFIVNPDYVGVFFTDPRGSSFLIAFVVLLASGLLTIRWLIQRSTQD